MTRNIQCQEATERIAAPTLGLIAEEVAKVYPNLVVRDEHGRIDGVRYDELTPILLSEVQQQQARLAAQDARLSTQDAALSDLRQQFAEIQQLNRAMQVALAQMGVNPAKVAMR